MVHINIYANIDLLFFSYTLSKQSSITGDKDMIINNKEDEALDKQKYLNPEEAKSNTFARLNKYMAQIQLEAAVLGINQPLVSVFSKDGNINQLTTKGNTLLEEVLIFWLHGMYGFINNLIDFIEYVNFLINQNARFTDELNIQIQQDISKEVSNFIEPIDDSKCTAVAYKKENVAFISISNARLRMSRLLESDFCHNNCLFSSHFNINGNKGYAQKDYSTGMRNYVVYRGCINMRASWSVVSPNKNSPQITKKESIGIHINGNGTIHVSKQDKLRYKNGEIDFNGCNVRIGGVMLEDALRKGHWLYSNNLCNSGYCSSGTSPERKTPIFDSNGNNLVNPDACKINQESNKDLPIKDNPVSDAEKDQLIDSEDSLSNDYESTEIGSSTFELLQSIEAISINKNDIKKAEEENGKIAEENKACLRKLNSNKFYAKLSKGKRCNYDQQMTIAYIDNNQENSEYNDQNNNVTESNRDNSIDQYCENMDMDNEALTFADSTISVQDKVAAWLNYRQNERDFEKNCYNNNSHLRKDSLNATTSNAIPSLGERDRSSANDLSWDDITLGSNDIEFDYNPPRKALSSNHKYRNNSISSRLGILHEIPSYNLNELLPLITVIDGQGRVVYTEFKNN